jgi:hypothetical protein
MKKIVDCGLWIVDACDPRSLCPNPQPTTHDPQPSDDCSLWIVETPVRPTIHNPQSTTHNPQPSYG